MENGNQENPGQQRRNSTRSRISDLLGLLQDVRHQPSFAEGQDQQDHQIPAAGVGVRGASAEPATRPKPTGAHGDSLMSRSLPAVTSQTVAEEFPDQTMILERLTSIRQHKRQVLDLIDKLKAESVDGQIDKDMLRKLIEAYDNFKDQEEQYLSILQKILALKSEFATSLADSFVSDSGVETAHSATAQAGTGHRSSQNLQRAVAGVKQSPNVCDSGIASGGRDGEKDELQALVEQRDMLRRMLEQQRELLGMQEQQTAQRGEAMRDEEEEMNPEYEMAYQQVYRQQEVLASKRRELEELKEKLDNARSFYSDSPTQDQFGVEKGHSERSQLEDKLRVLRGKKQRMDEMINELTSLHGGGGAGSEGGEHQRESPNAGAPSGASGGQQTPTANGGGARPKQPSANVPSSQQWPRMEQPSSIRPGMPQPEEIRRKLMELEATKSRLAQLQTLVTELEDSSGNPVQRLGVSPQLMRLVNELEHEHMNQSEPGNENSDDSGGVNPQMRSMYQSKLNEQRDAMEQLQEEHTRLTAIKNQLLKLNPLADPLAAERAAAAAKRGSAGIPGPQAAGGVPRSGEDLHGELQAVARQPQSIRRAVESRLNNTLGVEFSPASQQRNRSSVMTPNEASMATPPPTVGGNVDEFELDRQPVRSRTGTGSGGSAIVNNPQLASFRRNNQLEESRKQRRQLEQPMAVGNRRRRSSSTIDHQYQQLQQHIDSIRVIFQDLMREHEEYGNRQAGQQRQFSDDALYRHQQQMPAPTVAPWADTLGLSPSALAVHQHQLMLSLLACQQQLQLQQLEMRYLQQLYQELWHSNLHNDGGRTRSGSVSSVQQPAPLQHPGAPGAPFGLPGFAPFDGRPLSSASLYNLLAPNPYLTLPYYPSPQFAPQTFTSAAAARGLARSHNGVQSIQRDSGVLNNSYVGPMASGSSVAAKSNRNVEMGVPSVGRMSSSVICQEGHQRGEGMGERMIVSDSDISLAAESASPSKVGGAARRPLGEYAMATNGGNKASMLKSNLEDPYSKSNVNKAYNKNSNANTIHANGVIPELPSRASSTSGVVTRSGHASALENGSITPEQFDSMRDVIYSEVATLISQNEQRPNFLLELFRELQLLTNDYLRSRAMEAIRDILNRYLTDDADTPNNLEIEQDRWLLSSTGRPVSVSDSDSRIAPVSAALPGTQDRNAVRVIQRSRTSTETYNGTREQVGTVVLSNSVTSSPDDFTANAGSEKSSSRQKRFENLEGIKDVKNSAVNNESSAASATATQGPTELSRTQSRDFVMAAAASNGVGGKVDTTALEQQVQTVVDDLVPFVRGNVDADCTPQLLQYIRKLVLELTASKCVPKETFTTFFRLQLSSILDDTLAKFRGQKLHECGAELLADISEVVFNEVGFFRLMQNIDSSVVSRSQHGTASEESTTDVDARNAETSESAPLDDVVSETTGDRIESELSSSRQSSLEDELSPLSVHDAVSEISEDLSAVTTINVEPAKTATMKVVLPGLETTEKTEESVVMASSETEESIGESSPKGRRKSTETVLVAPLTVQVTAATDEEEITTTSNNSSPSSPSSGTQSMHTAGAGNSITSDQADMLKTPPTGDSRETTPPDDVDEVPEQLEHELRPPADGNDVTFDLTFEPHPEDQAQLTTSDAPSHAIVISVAEEEEEEDEHEHETLNVSASPVRPSTPVVTARAVAYVAESSSAAEVGLASDTAAVAGVVTTAN